MHQQSHILVETIYKNLFNSEWYVYRYHRAFILPIRIYQSWPEKLYLGNKKCLSGTGKYRFGIDRTSTAFICSKCSLRQLTFGVHETEGRLNIQRVSCGWNNDIFQSLGYMSKLATYLSKPKSSYSSLITISFPELSLAFPMLKVAKMDAKVSHNCSARCHFSN